MKTSAAAVRLALALSAAGPLMAGNRVWNVAAGFGWGGVSVGVQVGTPAAPAVCPPAPVAVPVACPPPAPVVVVPAPPVWVVHQHAHRPPPRRRVFHPAAAVWVAPAPVVMVAPVAPPPPVYPVVVAHPAFCR